MKFETVIGLEVHVEMATKSKIFCACSAEFGGEQNDHVCPACCGMPGMLPIVNKKVVELGMTTRERIKRISILTMIALFVPMIVLVPLMVYGINGARGFWNGFWQMLVILMISGLFDRIFIDWWWVGHTKAWIIPGTEDLRPYIYGKTLVKKWVGTLVGFPILAAVLAGIMQLI